MELPDELHRAPSLPNSSPRTIPALWPLATRVSAFLSPPYFTDSMRSITHPTSAVLPSGSESCGPKNSHGLRPRRSLVWAPLAGVALWAVASCGGGVTSDSGASGDKFSVESVNVLEGMEWKLNRSIDITFNDEVDFSTVTMNTVNVTDPVGRAATGVFSFPTLPDGTVDKRTVRFQPNCPRLADFSDAGLVPNTSYRLVVLGSDQGGVTVRSASGEELEIGVLVNFSTPNSTDALTLFLDTVPGPPSIRLRGSSGVATDDLDACFVDLGGQSIYFELNLSDQTGRIPVELPLNHYSIPENQVSVVVHFNQPVDATPTNINSSYVSIQYFDSLVWTDIQSDMDLFENCTETGAALRMIPRGILPQDSPLRVVVRQGFADLTGDSISSDLTKFAMSDTVQAGDPNPLFPGIGNPEVDEVLETFTIGGTRLGSLEDTVAAFEVPRADWGNGELKASFDFGGTGGPGGDFDWHLPPGVDVILNTVSDTIIGGPGGAPTGTQAVINGVIDIRNMFVPASTRLIVQGPNTCTILATGTVTVLGEISVRGADNPGVGTLNTTNQPEPGAKGNAGGGDGGTGSFLTSQSTPQGGTGQGAFSVPNGGGVGGESSYSKKSKDARRAAGGGGGVFGPDIYYDYNGNNGNTLALVQTLVGLDVERGAGGGADGLGAVSQSIRAQGGSIGPSPFIDLSADNNFYGTILLSTGQLLAGELTQTWAGAGGGGGGDAIQSDTFPGNWTIGGDEKGAGGGGGGGGLKILSIGAITVGSTTAAGSLAAEGGNGGGGENVIFFDRVGGGSGAGAGGHLVVSSADKITIYGSAQDAGIWYNDDNNKLNHWARAITAVGGQGGAGNTSWGGANEDGPSPWRCDRIPWENLPYTDQPPNGLGCFKSLPDIDDLVEGPVIGAGGDGSPGLIQFHVPDPELNLVFPTLEAGAASWAATYDGGLDISPVCAPPPVGFHRPKLSEGDPDWIAPDYMVPFFGDLSRAQTKWIPLGLARVAPGGFDQVRMRFEGTSTVDGRVGHDGSTVQQLPPIIGPDQIGSLGSPPYIDSDGYTFVLDSSGMAAVDGMYKENTQLLRGFSVKLEDGSDPMTYQFYVITSASYDAGLDRLTCAVDPSGPVPDNFIASGPIMVSLVPHFLRVITNGIHDSFPVDSEVQMRFDAAKVDPGTGLPGITLGWTFDPNDMNADQWDFIRMEIEFEIELDVTAPRPGLDHLRMSYEF